MWWGGGVVKFVHGEISLGDHENSHGETKRSSHGGGGVKFFYQETSLGHHEISHGEISPGYQENLLVNKFPVLTPPPNFCSRRSRGELIFNISSGVRLLVPIETPNLLM